MGLQFGGFLNGVGEPVVGVDDCFLVALGIELIKQHVERDD